MKKYFYLFLVSFFIFQISFAFASNELNTNSTSCDGGSIVFYTQEDVDAFGPCTHWDGSMSFPAYEDITDFSAFDGLIEITGNLIFQDSEISNLTGFNQLETIGGQLRLSSNAFVSINAFANLVSVEESFVIAFNNILETIAPLSHLQSCASLYIQNQDLKNLNAFSTLNQIDADLSIIACSSIENLNGLSNIQTVGGNLSIINNENLSDCCGIYNLLSSNSVGGTIEIVANFSCNSPDEIITNCSPPSNYCSSTSDFPWHEWISKVQLNTINNTSGKSIYSDFTSETTSLNAGSSNDLSLETSFSYTTYDEYWRIWIDFNQDGDFTDYNEMVLQKILNAPPNGTDASSISAQIYIPINAMNGATRMRVSMKRGAYAEPCETLAFGEVEDYGVYINTLGPLAELSIPNYEIIQNGTGLCYSEIGEDFGFFGGTILNGGDGPAGAFKLSVSFSTDDQISSDDILWEEFSYAGLLDGDATYFTVGNPVPTALAPGMYYAIMHLDSENQVQEYGELNNIIPRLVRIGAPDFTINTINGLAPTVAPNATINFSADVENLSPYPLLELTDDTDIPVEIYFSEDATLDLNNDMQIGATAIAYDQLSNAPLFENGIATVNLSATIPNGISNGEYYIFVRLVPTCETDLQNNVSTAQAIQIDSNLPDNYCSSTSNFPWHDWIAFVHIANLNNGSGKSTYSDFTNHKADLVAGASYGIGLTTGYSYYTFDEYWSVWIDVNHNNIFEPEELLQTAILDAPPNGTDFHTTTRLMVIPADALTGPTRMRISMTREDFADPCETLSYGEVEDYTVNISAPIPRAELAIPSYEVIPSGLNLCYTDLNESYNFFGGTIINFGDIASGDFKVRFSFSIDDQPSNDDILWKENSYSSLPPSWTDDFDIEDPVPASLEPGIYYVLIQIDPDNQVEEEDETNNLISVRVRIGAPDFSVSQVNDLPSTASSETSFDFSSVLLNESSFPLLDLANQNLTVQVYLSEDDIFNTLQDINIGTTEIDFAQFSNAPNFLNGTATADLTALIPEGTAIGEYYIFVRIPFSCEKNALNNTSNPMPIQIIEAIHDTYCNSSSNIPWYDWIAFVQIANLHDGSGKSTYSDFTHLAADLQAGASYGIGLTTGFSYYTYAEHWSVWIDINHNNTFDPSELLYTTISSVPPNGTAYHTTNETIHIPSDALDGPTRMRIAMSRDGFTGPCETFSYGEVEDYTVNISNNNENYRRSLLALDAAREKNGISLFGAYRFSEPIDQIEIQRSANGEDYDVLTQVPSQEIGETVWQIKHFDQMPFDGDNYYRVFVKFKNGEEQYSAIKKLNFNSLAQFTIFPNPASDEIYVQLEQGEENDIEWSINDSYGRVLWTATKSSSPNFTKQINIRSLDPGLYFLFAKIEGKKPVGKRFVIIR